jgi:glycine/D-amino acid oxidase-like deaminating enzyme
VLWLEQAAKADPEGGAAIRVLEGEHRVDVAIVGGGFTGLWAALEVRRRHPDLRVAIVEAARCGSGASGRNGGWAVGWYDHFDALVAQFGDHRAVELAQAGSDAVAELGERAGELGIDCEYRRSGSWYVASTRAQDHAWAAAAAAAAGAGQGAMFHEISADDLLRRTATPLSVGVGAVQAGTATLHPGRLVRGLRRAVLDRGVEIFEQSPVVSLVRGRLPLVRTAGGTVVADRILLAVGAWGARVRELRGAVLPFASHVVATAPAGDLLARMGIAGPLAAADAQMLVSYLQITGDGRMVFGRGSGPVASRVGQAHFGIQAERDRVIATLHRWYPELTGVPVTHAWAGPVDVAPGYFPFAGTSPDGRIAYACGYSGDGVAQSLLMSRIAVSLALGEDDRWSRSPLATGPRRRFPAPALAALAGRSVHGLVRRGEDREERTGERPVWASAVEATLHRVL